MSMIQVHGLTKYYGSTMILDSIVCEIEANRKIGLIGRNGSGKSTFLRILTGEDTEFDGAVIREPGLSIGYVPQYLESEGDLTVEEYLTARISGLTGELRRQEALLADAAPDELERTMAAYQRARDAYDAAEADVIASRTEMLLDEFGLSAHRHNSVETLSGGEKNLLGLARTVLDEPDLLVLDEPGNHLDYVGLDRLESYLKSYPGSVLVVSHNRYLLDRVVDEVCELDAGTITAYHGNYSAYRMQKLKALTAQQADYAANQKRLQRLEALVARFAEIAHNTADTKWGKRLRARRTQLAHAKREAVEKPELDRSAIDARLSSGGSKADFALQVHGYSRVYGENVLFENAGFSLYAGEHLALLGPNGSGKTTFLDDLIANGSWDDRTIRVGPSMRVAYCAQNQHVFDLDQTVLDAFRTLAPLTRDQVHTVLRRYLFAWSDLEKRIGDLSGGELNRLQIARAQVLNANFLVLDEPTNHLDIAAREAIEEAIDEFDGTVLVVSHDRYFLDKVATRIVAVVDLEFVEYSGTFSEYWRDRNAPERDRRTRTGGAKPGDRNTRPDTGEIELRIEEHEREKIDLEHRIGDAFARRDHMTGRALSTKLEKVVSRLAKLYDEWEEIETGPGD